MKDKIICFNNNNENIDIIQRNYNVEAKTILTELRM